MLSAQEIKKLNLDVDDVPAARLTFSISLYMAVPLTSIGAQVIQAYERFLQIVGKENLRWYATENMSKHKAVTAKTLAMLPSWFAPKAPKKELYGFEIHDGEEFNAAATSLFEMTGAEEVDGERLEDASLIRFVLPPSWGTERHEEALALTKELCQLLPFRSGHAGYAFQCSRYFEEEAVEHAWAAVMKHPGIDIHQTANDTQAVGLDGVRGVGWLTMLDDKFVKQLGGPPSLSSGAVVTVKGGVIVQAQDKPAIGNVNKKDNLPAYREVYRYIEPLTADAFERSGWLQLEDDEEDRTERFYKRLS